MRKSFDKDKSVLAEDYVFFTGAKAATPDAPTCPSRVVLGRGHGPSGYPQDGVERVHWVEAPVEAEHELVQVRLQVLWLDPSWCVPSSYVFRFEKTRWIMG